MKSVMLLTFLFVTQGIGAQTIHDNIHSIVRGENKEPHLIKFDSGLVEIIEHDDVQKLELFEKRLKVRPYLRNKSLMLEETSFAPTIMSDENIQLAFKRMNIFMRRKSECSDRAHVWAWDEYQRNGTKSEKVFLLLTDTYIKKNRYKWWFHVAPLFTSNSGQKMVTDVQFFDRPVTFNEWKNHLVFSHRECVSDFRFLDYNAGADQTQDCYAKFEPMYYRIPGDIGNRENGIPRTGWNTSEVNASRSRAFFKGSAQ